MTTEEKKRKRFSSEILKWGKLNERDFPWRHEKNAFHILVAEIMLQRTAAKQVKTVYENFITKFPTIESLAIASFEEISEELRSIGLAYRANRLKRISVTLQTKYGGKVPMNESELESLPGVGKYVANAVRCFAFRKQVPLVDSNILRVFNRVFSIGSKNGYHKKQEIWDFASILVPEGFARDYNLYLLDFASLICSARNPKHHSCFIKEICDFYQNEVNKRQ